jgi:hypothetical protein
MEDLRKEFDLTPAEEDRMIRLNPTLENAMTMTNARPNMDFLRGERLKLSHAELRKMVLTSPALFNYNIDNNMEPKLAYLEKRLSLNQSELRKMIITLPPLFGINIDDNMEPKLAYLEERLLLNQSELPTANQVATANQACAQCSASYR